MGVPGNASPLLLTSAAGAAAGYQISRSVRFNSSDSAYCGRNFTSAGNRTTFTYALWVKRSGASQPFHSLLTTPSNNFIFRFQSDSIVYYDYTGSSFNSSLQTASVYRDFSAWMHIVFVYDSTNGVYTDRIKLFVNGARVTAFSTATYGLVYPSSNAVSYCNNNVEHRIGSDAAFAGRNLDAYLADIHFIDGQALDPSSFGEFDTNGVWQPVAYTGSYGTNGFRLPFSDNSAATATTLGKDSAGSNNWTPNNLSVTAGAGNDSLVDSPTNGTQTDTGVGGQVVGNYATLNPLDQGSNITLSNGNLDITTSTGWRSARSTFGITSGKWYWEVTGTSGSQTLIGIAKSSASLASYIGSDAFGWSYYSANGNKFNNNNQVAYGATYTSGDIIGVTFDADSGALTFYKNNTSQGTAYTGLTSGPYFPSIGIDTSVAAVFNFGQRPFAYTAPSGFKALCTTNLPEPVVAKPSTVMGIATYSGNNGLNTLTTGVDASTYGGLLWIKNRSSAAVHNILDNLRGYTNLLEPPLTAAEYSGNVGMTETSTGYTLNTGSAQYNASGSTYVAWHWAGGTSTVTNTAGSITSQVRANVSAGFSIVAFTATTGTGSIGHGLGVPPSLIILKSRNNISDWVVYHASLGAGKYLNMNTTDAAFTNTSTWQNTTPTSTVFYSNGPFATGWTEVAYCFAPVAGYSSFGSYVGNGSSDGPFVYTGFRPRWVMVKYTSGAGGHWMIRDAARNTFNAADEALYANLSGATDTGSTYSCDFLSNGFKVRGVYGSQNISAGTYIYAAFAESPFAYARAR